MELKRTPLYDRHVRLNGKIVDFAGWALPVQYEGIVAEHLWTRQKVSLFDICHMGQIKISGQGAAAELDRLLTNNISTLAIGRCRYSLMLNPDGFIIDDLIVYKLADDDFMIVVNAATTQTDYEWFKGHIKNGIVIENISDSVSKLDIQGPLSAPVVSEFFGIDVFSMPYFSFQRAQWRGNDIILSRTGYTGEIGFEIYCNPDAVGELWDALLAVPDVKPAGLGARDTLRLEMGYPLYGNDIHLGIDPISACLERFIGRNKEFIGQEALPKSPRFYRRGVVSSSRRPLRHGQKIVDDAHNVIAELTSGGFSPSLNKGIGMGYVPTEFEQKRMFASFGNGALEAVEVVDLPMYKNGTVRVNLEEYYGRGTRQS